MCKIENSINGQTFIFCLAASSMQPTSVCTKDRLLPHRGINASSNWCKWPISISCALSWQLAYLATNTRLRSSHNKNQFSTFAHLWLIHTEWLLLSQFLAGLFIVCYGPPFRPFWRTSCSVLEWVTTLDTTIDATANEFSVLGAERREVWLTHNST